jgi:hypothetical protein
MLAIVVGYRVATDRIRDPAGDAPRIQNCGQQLFFQIHREKPRAGVDHLVTDHGAFLCGATTWSLDITFASRQDAWMNTIFLQFR